MHPAQQEVVTDTTTDPTAKVDDSVAANTRAIEARGDIVADQEAHVVTPLINQRDNAMTHRKVVQMIVEIGTRLEVIVIVNLIAAAADDVEVTMIMIEIENHANLVVEIGIAVMEIGDLIVREMIHVVLLGMMSHHLDEERRFGMVMDHDLLLHHHLRRILHQSMEIREVVEVEIGKMIGTDAREVEVAQDARESVVVVVEMITDLTTSGGEVLDLILTFSIHSCYLWDLVCHQLAYFGAICFHIIMPKWLCMVPALLSSFHVRRGARIALDCGIFSWVASGWDTGWARAVCS
jgi:hypothetical protein